MSAKPVLRAILLAPLVACSTQVPGPTPTPPDPVFHAEVLEVFDFDPALLSAEKRSEKETRIRSFVARVREHESEMYPRIRAELAMPAGVPPIFVTTGAQCLLGPGVEVADTRRVRSRADFELARDALGRCDTRTVSAPIYFFLAHTIAQEGLDVLPCVHRTLDNPGFKVFLPQHVITLRQDMCAMYLTMLMKDNQWLPALIDRLTREQNLSVAQTILLCVYESVTDDGYRAIREYAQKGPLPQGRAFASRIGELLQEQKPPPQKLRASREHLFDYIDDLVARNYRNSAYDWKTYEAEAVHLVRAEDYDRIMNIRRMHAVRVSDEALDELMELSKLLRRAYALRKG